jgi:hypothetical protein
MMMTVRPYSSHSHLRHSIGLEDTTDMNLLQFQCWDLERERDEARAERDEARDERDEALLLLHQARLETSTWRRDAASAAKFMLLATQHLHPGPVTT